MRGIRSAGSGLRRGRVGARRLALVAASVAVLALVLAPAASATLYVGSFFGNPTNAAGNTGGLFNNPRGVAVNNSTGHVYVADQSNQRIHQLDASGNFVRAWGRDVIITGRNNDGGTAGFEICDTTAALPNVAGDCKAGSNAGTTGGQMNTPQGVAVNQSTGHVYVTDGGRLRVQEFDASGNFVRAWGRDVIIAGRNNDSGTSAFEICDTTAALPNVAADCKAGVSAGTGGAFASTFDGYIAVVPAGAPNAGNVLVADPGNRRMQEFTASGAFVRAFGADIDASTPGTGFEVCTVVANCQAGPAGDNVPVGRFATGYPKRVAADGTGRIYTVEAAGLTRRVQSFTQGPGPSDLTPQLFADAIVGTSGDNLLEAVDITIDPANNHVYVARFFGESQSGAGYVTCQDGSQSVSAEVRVLELSAAGQLLDTHLECAGFNGSGTFGIRGLAFRPAGGPSDSDRLYAASNFSGGSGTTHRVYVLDDDGVTPALSEVTPAADVTDTTAQLSGSVNPNSVDNSFAPTLWRLEYSRDGVEWRTAASGSLAAGTVAQPVSGTATDLAPNTLYRTRVVTVKPFGNSEISSAELTFLTDAVKPGINAVRADSVTDTAARLTGQVVPRGTPTRYRFEWGEDGFDNVTPLPDGPVGAGQAAVFVSQQVAGLEPNTTYRFRLVATSDTEGASTSAVKTFTTRATPPGPGARAYELVTPQDKVSGVGVGEWYEGPGSMAGSGLAARVGDRFAAQGTFGSILVEGAHAWANDWAFVDRINDEVGWRSHSPLTHPNHRAALAGKLSVSSTAHDMSRFYWDSPQATPAVFPELVGDWAKVGAGLLSDWGAPPTASTRWELFGPESLDQVASTVDAADPLLGTAVSADGSRAVGLTRLLGSSGFVRGLAGPGDPTDIAWGGPGGDLLSGRSIYSADIAGELADSFDGTGSRTLVNVCTGTVGVDRTELPVVDGDGDMTGAECPAALAGRDARLLSDHGASFVRGPHNKSPSPINDVVSRDGSRTFFMSPDPSAADVPDGSSTFCATAGDVCPPQLYVRQENPDGSVTTRWLSRAENGLFGAQDASLTGAAFFEGATPDGDKVFFRTSSPLTADDPNGTGSAPPPGGVTTGNASGTSWDLYMYDLPDAVGADPADGELTRISAGPTGDGDCNSPVGGSGDVGALRFASDDGARVVFTCGAPLAGVGPASNGTITTPGGSQATLDETNLYAYDETPGQAERWRFVARLPRVGTDGLNACAGTGVISRSPLGSGAQDANILFPGDVEDTNCVSGPADGGLVVFMTAGRLTADDPVAPLTGDVYGYDLERDELYRLSAPQGGVGGTYPCAPHNSDAVCVGDLGVGSQAGVSVGTASAPLNVVTHPMVSGGKTVFLQSRVRLVPEDTDDAYDVYQWVDGDLSLVSTGKSSTDGALYKGADVTGRNVYFVTRDRLTWQDVDSVADVYVARVGDGIAQPAPPVLCDALQDTCQPEGGGPADLQPRRTREAGDGDVTPLARRRLIVVAPSRSALRRASRSGVLALRVRSSRGGLVTARASGRVGRARRSLGAGRARLVGPGTTTLRLRLSPLARKRLRQGGLRLSVVVRAAGARPRVVVVALKGGRR